MACPSGQAISVSPETRWPPPPGWPSSYQKPARPLAKVLGAKRCLEAKRCRPGRNSRWRCWDWGDVEPGLPAAGGARSGAMRGPASSRWRCWEWGDAGPCPPAAGGAVLGVGRCGARPTSRWRCRERRGAGRGTRKLVCSAALLSRSSRLGHRRRAAFPKQQAGPSTPRCFPEAAGWAIDAFAVPVVMSGVRDGNSRRTPGNG